MTAATAPGPVAAITVGVLGAGTMGAGIAQVAAWAGHTVVLYDIGDVPLRRGLDGVAAQLRKGAHRGKHTLEQAESTIGRIHATTKLAEMARCGLIVEAAPESLELKQAMFGELANGIVRDTCVLASNTSTLSIASLAKDIVHPERVCGMHFFNPAPLMPLVEVIRGPLTADEVVTRVTGLATSWGKTPVVCADTPGFIVNRVARPYYGEALRLLGDGLADVATIDRLARDAGFPMGPFELMDLIGIDVNFSAAQSVFDGYFGEPRFRPHPIQRQMVESGRLGRKTGQGYYVYDPDGKPITAGDDRPALPHDPVPWSQEPGQHLLVLGDRNDPVDALARRLASAGIDTVGVVLGYEDPSGWQDLVPGASAVIEITVRDPRTKAQTLMALDEVLAPETLLLTCCNAHSVTKIAAITDHPERVVGFGLHTPIGEGKLVECARALQTTDSAADTAAALWHAAGLEPVWVGDGTALVMPRILACLANEAAFAVQERVATPAAIDQAMKLGTRYPRGPLEWAGLIGFADVLATLDALAADLDPARYRASALLRRAMAGGLSTLEQIGQS